YSLLFCLVMPVRHRDLHSFPTRRSSDLIIRGGERGDGFEDSGEYPDRRKRNQCSPASRTRRNPVDSARLVHFTGTGRSSQGGPRDRKSTRLNSSHVSISYAVFCLKKKKK